jgi:CheY-like chemotaxis protein
VAIAVVIVEDEALVRMHLAQTLQDAGFLTFEARTAAEAIDVMEANSEIRVARDHRDYRPQGTAEALKWNLRVGCLQLARTEGPSPPRPCFLVRDNLQSAGGLAIRAELEAPRLVPAEGFQPAYPRRRSIRSPACL